MKFLIESLNDTDCRIVGLDCSGLQGQVVDELTIPATVEHEGKTYLVKEVGDGVCHTNKFDENAAKYAALRRLKKIIFSEGIEAIGGVMNAFGSNADERGNGETLKEVVLPSTLKVIGKNSFCYCKQLCSINIPDGVEVIDDRAFSGCESLTWFQWPKRLRIIGNKVFDGTLMLTDDEGKPSFVLDIPDSIEQIGHIGKNTWGENELGSPYSDKILLCKVSLKAWPVFDVSGLTSKILEIDIPEGVTKISGQYRAIRKIKLPSTLEVIDKSVFAHSNALGVISELPASLKTIGDNAFWCAYESDGPKEIIIPSSVESVGQYAFYTDRCKIKLLGDEVTMSRLMAQPGALNGTLVESIDIPEGATEVNVENCPELERLSIPSTVTKITIISNCPKLKSLIIPDSVTLIDEISKCESLETLQLSAYLEQLKVLNRCPKIKELHLPDSIKKFKDDPDNWATVLENLHARIYASLEVWKLLCSNKRGLWGYEPESKKLEIPEGVESIAESLLRGSEIEALTLPSTLKEIGAAAFSVCKILKSMTIPAGVKALPGKVLSDCLSLEAIEFADGSQLEEIGYEAFSKTALKQLTLPDGFKKLSREAIKDCETIESVTFPASMTDFGFSANDWGDTTTPFVRCKNLKYVVFLADDPATAVYPVALGKLCDWYVPDHMVDHVKAFIEKAKADYPKVKGVGAKKVLPLSKLKGNASAPAPKKKASPKKADSMTQAIKMLSGGTARMSYRFAVLPEDMPMLTNSLDRDILAARYMRDKASECSVKILFPWSGDCELVLETKVNSASEKFWHATPKTIVDIDYTDKGSLPEDFPEDLAAGLAQYGSFNKYFASKIPNYDKGLPDNVPAYLEITLDVRIEFDFMVGEKEKFNVKKITVPSLWEKEHERFVFMYNGRYINPTSVGTRNREQGVFGNFDYTIAAYKDVEFKEKLEMEGIKTEGFRIKTENYINPSLPLADDILSLLK